MLNLLFFLLLLFLFLLLLLLPTVHFVCILMRNAYLGIRLFFEPLLKNLHFNYFLLLSSLELLYILDVKSLY